MIYMLIVSLIVIGLDILTKQLVVTNIEYGSYIKVIDNFFYLTYVKNDGVAFSINIPLWILIVIASIATIFFMLFSRKLKFKDDKWIIITIGFLMGGTIGNFIDRIFRADHMVVDFLSFYIYYPSFKNGFHFASFPFAIFNVADSFLVVGAIMFAIYVLFIEGKKNINKDKAEEVEVVNIKNE